MKIAIINPLGNQFEALKKEFPDLDLRNIQDRVPAGTFDFLIGMVKFIPHPFDGRLRKEHGVKYRRVTGSVESIKRTIRQILQEQEA